MALPPRGTGLITGTARAERGLGIPLSEYERAIRHQRLYLPVGLSAKPYPIPRFTVKIPMLAVCSGWIGKPVTITWDPVKTTVSSSRLVIRAISNADPVRVNVNFNGAPVKEFFWGEGTKGTELSDVIDVPIINGTNELGVRACKNYPWVGVVGVDVNVYVEVTFEGETPQRPWGEVLWEWLTINWPWLAIGAGLVIIGGVTYVYLARPRS